jgi:hypothetical protein
MLHRFLRDPDTKAALGIFMAMFIYALTVLRVVGTGTNKAFVPSSSISLAIFLLLVNILMFLRLLTTPSDTRQAAANWQTRCWIRADTSPRCTPSTCGNWPPLDDHPDLRGHQPDPARRDGPPAGQVVVMARQLVK